MRRQIDALFEAALDLPAAERAAFLDSEVADPAMRAAVERLLVGSDETASMLADLSPWRGDLGRQMAAALSLEPASAGDRIGPFRVVRELGRGGMAAVYLAERADGHFEQQVALKLVNNTAPSQSELLRRFQNERQILASLDHPSIARLLDGGLTEEGRPYFAMELVDGTPIDQHCDEHQLSIHDRLRLMIDVARATEAAHRALIVHRDIKPSNVMVTHSGAVKLLDFGIAKQMVDNEADLTRTAGTVMTPEYASPEQFRGQLVTTASDVYQLGLLLYQLLTGERPYRLAGLSPVEAERVICGEEPERPSTRFSRLSRSASETASTISQLRRTRPAELRRLLAGDLDRIVMAALRKDPERRYRSAAELADDLESYLTGHPIRARGDSALYLTQKFLQRHRLAVSMAAGVAALLIGVVTFYTAQLAEQRNTARLEAERASKARDEAVAARLEAEHTTKFLVDLFHRSDPWEGDGTEPTARQLLDEGAEKVRRQLAEQPLTQAHLLDTIGSVYRRLSLYDQAEAAIEDAYTLRREHLEPGHEDLADSLYSRAYLHLDRGDLEAAAELFKQAIDIFEVESGPRSKRLGDALNGRATAVQRQGHYEEAEKLLQRSLAIDLELSGRRSIEAAASMANLALNFHRQGREEEAIALYEEVLELEESLLGPNDIRLATSLNNLGTVYDQMGHTERSLELYRRSLKIKETFLGADHPLVASSLVNLASVLKDVGHLDEAEAMLLRAAEILERKAPRHAWLGNAYTNLASLALKRPDLERAEKYFKLAFDLRLEALGPNHPDIGAARYNFGDLYLNQGRVEDATTAYEQALEIWRRSLVPDHTYLGFGLTSLAELRLAAGATEEAEKLFAAAVEILTAKVAPSHEMRQRAARGYAEVLEARGFIEQAQSVRQKM